MVFRLTRPGLEPMLYPPRDKHVNRYATDMVVYIIYNSNMLCVKPFCHVFYSIVCRYLSHIVTVDNALDLLSGHMTNYQTVLIQTWIRCAMFVPSASQQLQALNRYIYVREYQRGNQK